MGKIFAKQSALRITIRTFINLEGITKAAVKYRKPNGKTGEWGAGVVDIEKGVISHECIEGEIDITGWWALWAFVTFADGRTAAGETAKVYIWSEGQ